MAKVQKRTWKRNAISQKNLKKRDEVKGNKYSKAKVDSYINSEVVNVFLPHDGDNAIRIIQPLEVEELGYYGKDVHFHRDVGGSGLFPLCPSRMHNKPCPICRRQTSQLWDEDPDIAKTYYPNWRVLMWVQDYKNQDEDSRDEILLWSAPKTLADEILLQSHRKEADTFVDVSDPFEGRMVYFTRTGKGIQTDYDGVQIGSEPDQLSEELIDQMRFFDDVLIEDSYEDIEKAFLGDYSTSDSDDEPASYRDEPKQEEQGEPEPEKDECFGKEWDKYEDCAECYWSIQCQEEATAKPGKPKKAAKPSKAEKPVDDEPETKAPSNQQEIRDRLAAAIARKRKK